MTTFDKTITEAIVTCLRASERAQRVVAAVAKGAAMPIVPGNGGTL